MKKISVSIITLFPEIFPSTLNIGILKRTFNKNFHLKIVDLKAFSRRVDGRPAGGGSGMILKAEVLRDAILSVLTPSTKIFYMSPVGYSLNTKFIETFNYKKIIIICGRYEGIDARILDMFDVIPVSIGDYILAGGEVAALVFLESIIRYKLSVPLNSQSILTESFHNNLLEAPQYTKPNSILYKKKTYLIPEILLTGHSKKINEWKTQESLKLTKKYRPDLLEN